MADEELRIQPEGIGEALMSEASLEASLRRLAEIEEEFPHLTAEQRNAFVEMEAIIQLYGNVLRVF
jgi:hypothetical protein